MQQVMEDRSLTLVRQVIPDEWVIHDYKPDYGIDLVVEVFKYIDGEEKVAETLGELFFVQVKSIKSTTISKVNVYSRINVERSKLAYNKEERLEIDIIRFNIDTPELSTVQAMGSGLPVLLLLVSLDLNRVFFVCLNDLIEKVIIPEDYQYYNKNHKTIYVPIKNEVNTDIGLSHLRFYAKRSKFYAAFQKFEYQFNELRHLRPYNDQVNLEQLKHFTDIILRFDIWLGCEMWSVIGDYHRVALSLQYFLGLIESEKPNVNVNLLVTHAIEFWRRLAALAHVYEELCKEWCLPTHLAQYLSYPEYPEIQTTDTKAKEGKTGMPQGTENTKREGENSISRMGNDLIGAFYGTITL